MKTILLVMTALFVTGCVASENPKVQLSSGKSSASNVSGLAILELNTASHILNCTASFLTPRVLLTSASCLEFRTEQGDLGTIQSVQTGEFLPVDTIWSISAPTDPGDLGLVRLSRSPSVASVFDIKPGAMPTRISTRFGGTGCESYIRSATTELVEVPLETNRICPDGSGGVVFDTTSRALYALHVGTTPQGHDQYTELRLYSAQLSQATADLLGAPELATEQMVPESMTEDVCATQRRYNNGLCDEDCQRTDPDCQAAQPIRCQESNELPDSQCPPGCTSDPDCQGQANHNHEDLCQLQGLYGDGRCDSCPRLDPDCQNQTSPDFCETQNLYNNGICQRCPKPDPDCDETMTTGGHQSGDICLDLGVYGNGTCDAHCPQPDPDCNNAGRNSSPPESQPTSPASSSDSERSANQSQDRNDLCEVLDWYNDGECDTVCARPDPDCGTDETESPSNDTSTSGADPSATAQDECAINNWYNDGECDTFCPEPDPDCEHHQTSDAIEDDSDLCEALNWYGDGECDTVCARPDPDC